MLTNFFYCLKSFGVPVTIREHLDLLAAIKQGVIFADQEDFYHLARTVLVKDEKHFDKFDKAVTAFMSGLDSMEGLIEALIPDEWLRSEFIKQLSDEDKAKMDSMGGLDELIEQFKKRLEEQKKDMLEAANGSELGVHLRLDTGVFILQEFVSVGKGSITKR